MTNVTYTRKLGLNRGKARLWLEGAILLNHGFTHKSPWAVEVGRNEAHEFTHLDLIQVSTGDRLVAGTAARPIIDINSKAMLAGLVGPEVTITVMRPGWLRVTNKVEG